MFDLSEKKILITGASGGIGRDLSKSFLENGADVIITGTSSEKLKLLNEDLNSRCKIFESDLSSICGTNNLIIIFDGVILIYYISFHIFNFVPV